MSAEPTPTRDSAIEVGVVGLGRMGMPIARRLAASGHIVTGFDTDPSAATADGHLRVAADSVDLARGVDVVVTVLPGTPELVAAMTGAAGLIDAMRPGACWLDLTSCDPAVAADLASAAAGRGLAVVAAPMGGGPREAGAGSLRFLVGGSAAAITTVAPLLAALGGPDGAHTVGSSTGEAYLVKLLANTLWFGQVVAVSEAFLLAESFGLEPERLLPLLQKSAGGSVFLHDHVQYLLRGDYLADFGLSRVVEELEAVTVLAEDAGSPAPMTALVTRLHREALERFGPVDGELLAARLLEERAGRDIRRRP